MNQPNIGTGGPPVWTPALLLDIATVISAGDEAVLAGIKGWLEDIPEPFVRRSPRFRRQVQWLALVDILETGGHLCVRDWENVEREEFESALNALSGRERLGLSIEERVLEDNGCIAEWCALLDEEWKSRQCRVAALETYGGWALFPCGADEYRRLGELAARLGKVLQPGRRLKL